jgi:hypothetical protein
VAHLTVEPPPPPSKGYPIVDCPDHRSCALGFGELGVFCYACGKAVVYDRLIGLAAVDAGAELKAAARDAWRRNQGVRDFAASTLEKGKAPQT